MLNIKKMCTPATLYLVISFISLLFILIFMFFNLKMKSKDDNYNYKNKNIFFVILNSLYILLWTYILNFLCKKGYSSISWFLVLFPFLFVFINLFFNN